MGALLVTGTLKSDPPGQRAPHILAHPGGGGEVVEVVGRWWRCDLGSGIWDLGSGIWDQRSGIWDLGSGFWDLGSGIWDLGSE